jgi:ESS family glutamate:Na+ symporter
VEIIEVVDGAVRLNAFLSLTLGIVVLFIGKRLNDAFGFLRELTIPEPVTGGLAAALFSLLLYALTGLELEFDLLLRNYLLVYFFITIGMNASFAELRAGGRPLLILLLATAGTMVLQNITGISIAVLFGLEGAVGLLSGTVSLVGGHGTAIAWGGRFESDYQIASAMEIAIACATMGLILASLVGGPIARYLINRYQLRPRSDEPVQVGVQAKDTTVKVSHLDFLDAILAIHICGILGLILHDFVSELGLKLPLFVMALISGILISNLLPQGFPRISGRHWPSRSPAVALIADISLGTFLAMSLMSMQLWTLIDLALPILTILAAQVVLVAAVSAFVVFPRMGRNYDAAVISAGFAGYTLGATPVAMANMSAVTLRYGAAPLAFIVVPLVAAFFIDLINALFIPTFLAIVG